MFYRNIDQVTSARPSELPRFTLMSRRRVERISRTESRPSIASWQHVHKSGELSVHMDPLVHHRLCLTPDGCTLSIKALAEDVRASHGRWTLWRTPASRTSSTSPQGLCDILQKGTTQCRVLRSSCPCSADCLFGGSLARGNGVRACAARHPVRLEHAAPVAPPSGRILGLPSVVRGGQHRSEVCPVPERVRERCVSHRRRGRGRAASATVDLANSKYTDRHTGGSRSGTSSRPPPPILTLHRDLSDVLTRNLRRLERAHARRCRRRRRKHRDRASESDTVYRVRTACRSAVGASS